MYSSYGNFGIIYLEQDDKVTTMANKRKITKTIIEAKERLKTWDAVNDELFDGRMNLETLRIIATSKTGYFPVEKDILDILCPPKPKPLPTDRVYRNLGVICTEAELHEIQKKYSTRERAKRLSDD